MEKRTSVEVVSALGVIASLLFVGLQIQQSAEATRAATVLQLKESWVQLNLTNASSMELAEAWESVLAQGYEDAGPHSRRLVGAYQTAIMQNWSNAYYQFRLETLEEEQWAPILRDIEGTWKWEGLRPIWEERRFFFDEPFQQLMDSVMAAGS